MQNNVFLGDHPVCVCQVQKISFSCFETRYNSFHNYLGGKYVSGRHNDEHVILRIISTIVFFFFKQWQLIILCKHCKLLHRKLIYLWCIYLIYQCRDNIQRSLIQITGLCLQLSWHIHDWGHNSQIPVICPPGRAQRMVSHPITAAHCRGKSKLMPWTLESKVHTHTYMLHK